MRKITLLATGALVTALALAGCGSSGGGTAGQNGNSGNSGGASVEAGSSLSLLADQVRKTSSAKQSVHVVMNITEGEETVKGQGDMSFGGSPAIDLTLEVPEMAELAMRLVDGVFYLKLPDGLTQGKPWVKLDTKGTDPMSQTLGSLMEQVKDNGDPTKMLEQLKDSGMITAKKSEQLAGKDTTHYSVSIDVAKSIEKQTDPKLKKLLEDSVAKSGVKQLPLEMWVDAEGLPVRITSDQPTGDAGKTGKLVVDYSDWGKPVTVTAPTAGQVGELPHS
ncbi:MAG: hypothetical protein ACJ72N_21700 [Labedaea sp.]